MNRTIQEPTRSVRSGLLAAASLLAVAVAPQALAATIGDSLEAALAGAAAGDRLEVVVSFEGQGPLDADQVDALVGALPDASYLLEEPAACSSVSSVLGGLLDLKP